MGLSSIVDALRTHLLAALPSPPALIGAVLPATAGDLPTIVASLGGAIVPGRSLGSVPGPVMEGALRISSPIDLANPKVDVAGESVPLLSGDRRTLQIPHGSVVRADGSADLPFATTDILVKLGATTFTPVAPPPASATAVGLDPAAGTLTFRDPLPATGTVELGYFVGAWEVRAERFKAALSLQVFAASATAVEALSRDVEAALALERFPGASGFRSVNAVAIGSIGGITTPTGAFSRLLEYAVDFENIEPVILGAGGPIRQIAVTGVPPEPFVVT